ncbi:hypothetical protein HNY73_011758 [Argiope bruennichi]|uniref:Uncharacterized protein n=1 Tax=Argiope bruennichi TaxID=94029 RepID=A0A8T0ESU9_ARGBR|nr:hypothetical protein HNY73_011758 [Argiope bruennichi]
MGVTFSENKWSFAKTRAASPQHRDGRLTAKAVISRRINCINVALFRRVLRLLLELLKSVQSEWLRSKALRRINRIFLVFSRTMKKGECYRTLECSLIKVLGGGYWFTRRDSFFMLAKDAAAEQKERKPSINALQDNFPTSLSSLTAPSTLTSYPTGLTMLPAGCREEQSAQFLTEKFKEANCSSAPSSRTETPPSDASPQTPPAAPSSSPSRRNSDRRKRGFVRKNTQSAPDSFDNDDDSYSGVPTITHSSAETVDTSTKRNEGLSIGYFNFDSMQRLLDLSITASTKPEKPAFLLTPGGPNRRN